MSRAAGRGPARPERAFGLGVGAVLLAIAGWLLWTGRPTAAVATGGAGGALVVLGAVRPVLLRWPSALWWKVAFALGHVNARVVLTVIFVGVLTPIGLLWRLIGRDPLARDRRRWSGWSPYPARYRDHAHYRRLY